MTCADRVQAVAVALQCLSYDFVGTCLDESSEDLGTIQVQLHAHLRLTSMTKEHDNRHAGFEHHSSMQ